MDSLKLIAALSLFSFVVAVVAIATPGWCVFSIVVTTDTSSPPYYDTTITTETGSSLWYARTCVSSDDLNPVCLLMSYHDINKVVQERSGISLKFLPLIEAEIETTIGVAAILIASVLIFVYSRDTRRIVPGIVASFLLIAAGILLAIPTGRIWHANTQMEELLNFMRNPQAEMSLGVPYSLFIAAFGILLIVVVFFLLIIIIYRKRSESNVSQQHGYVVNQPNYSPVVTTDSGYHTQQAYGMKLV